MSEALAVPGTIERRAELREAYRTVAIVLLALLPVLLVYGAVEWAAWRAGETMSPQALAQWQQGQPDREWRGGDLRSFLTFKLARVHLLKPQVIMLGQSRANSFRAEFVAPYSFYNAGLTAWTFGQYRRFIELATTPDYAPQVLFCNLDFWMFASGNDPWWSKRFYDTPPSHVEALKVVLDQFQKTPADLPGRLWFREPNRRGMYAVARGNGFRSDGSLGAPAPSSDAQRLMRDNEVVGNAPVMFDEHIPRNMLAELDEFLALAKSKNIKIVGIQFPFYAKIVNGLNASPRAGTWREFEGMARQGFFESKGMLFFDFADMPPYRDKPEYFNDSLHPYERLAEIVIRRVVADPRVRSLLPDLKTK